MKRLVTVCCLAMLAIVLFGCKHSANDVVNKTGGQQPGSGNHPSALSFQLSYIDQQGELVLLNLDNTLKVTDKKVLSGQDNVQSGLGYHWVPDGTEVSYTVELPNQFKEVKFVGVGKDGAEGVRATLDAERETDPLCSVSWSPDGSLLAADYGTSPERELRLLNAATLKQVADLDYDMNFAWSPDGSMLAMGVEEPMKPPLPIESGDSITTVIYHVKDGQTQVVKKGTANDMFVPEKWLGPDKLLVQDLPAQGGSKIQFLECQITAGQFQLTPFNADNDASMYFEAEVRDAAKEEFNADDVESFSWSPDQKWLAFTVFEKNDGFIYVTPADKYSPVLIDKGWMPEWRPSAIALQG